MAKLWIQNVAPRQARPCELQQVRCSGPGRFEADLDQDRTEAHAGVDRRRFLGKAGQEAEVLRGQSGLLRPAVSQSLVVVLFTVGKFHVRIYRVESASGYDSDLIKDD